ncbi:hypothetical protein [Streptomyces pilosus]|uniref:Uncharacterized protein n=1 Tax=Streptomyces pilosus TaxID=28893 RepID=A0A918F4K1_9ACTN|nr:hypothetical protein [Streptomyces pilosus]GGR03829.1 hypothetical protein GCM10010280_59900 [Streptomyces pilosus]
MGQNRESVDAAQTRRRLRFSKLPERVRLEDTVEERPAVTHHSASHSHNPDWWLIRMGGV